jgi:hypothetical protein
MKTAVLLTADLMFGSKVEHMITAGGMAVEPAQTAEDAIAKSEQAALLIVDLTDERFSTADLSAASAPRLGYYAHTDDEVRRRALDNGYAKVVPRSRMMREGAELIKSTAS